MRTLPALALTLVAPTALTAAAGESSLPTSARLVAVLVLLVALLVAVRGVPAPRPSA